MTLRPCSVQEARQPERCKAEKQAVFPTHSATFPTSYRCYISAVKPIDAKFLFFPEKRQKEGTPSKTLQGAMFERA